MADHYRVLLTAERTNKVNFLINESSKTLEPIIKSKKAAKRVLSSESLNIKKQSYHDIYTKSKNWVQNLVGEPANQAPDFTNGTSALSFRHYNYSSEKKATATTSSAFILTPEENSGLTPDKQRLWTIEEQKPSKKLDSTMFLSSFLGLNEVKTEKSREKIVVHQRESGLASLQTNTPSHHRIYSNSSNNALKLSVEKQKDQGVASRQLEEFQYYRLNNSPEKPRSYNGRNAETALSMFAELTNSQDLKYSEMKSAWGQDEFRAEITGQEYLESRRATDIIQNLSSYLEANDPMNEKWVYNKTSSSPQRTAQNKKDKFYVGKSQNITTERNSSQNHNAYNSKSNTIDQETLNIAQDITINTSSANKEQKTSAIRLERPFQEVQQTEKSKVYIKPQSSSSLNPKQKSTNSKPKENSLHINKTTTAKSSKFSRSDNYPTTRTQFTERDQYIENQEQKDLKTNEQTNSTSVKNSAEKSPSQYNYKWTQQPSTNSSLLSSQQKRSNVSRNSPQKNGKTMHKNSNGYSKTIQEKEVAELNDASAINEEKESNLSVGTNEARTDDKKKEEKYTNKQPQKLLVNKAIHNSTRSVSPFSQKKTQNISQSPNKNYNQYDPRMDTQIIEPQSKTSETRFNEMQNPNRHLEPNSMPVFSKKNKSSVFLSNKPVNSQYSNTNRQQAPDIRYDSPGEMYSKAIEREVSFSKKGLSSNWNKQRAAESHVTTNQITDSGTYGDYIPTDSFEDIPKNNEFDTLEYRTLNNDHQIISHPKASQSHNEYAKKSTRPNGMMPTQNRDSPEKILQASQFSAIQMNDPMKAVSSNQNLESLRNTKEGSHLQEKPISKAAMFAKFDYEIDPSIERKITTNQTKIHTNNMIFKSYLDKKNALTNLLAIPNEEKNEVEEIQQEPKPTKKLTVQNFFAPKRRATENTDPGAEVKVSSSNATTITKADSAGIKNIKAVNSRNEEQDFINKVPEERKRQPSIYNQNDNTAQKPVAAEQKNSRISIQIDTDMLTKIEAALGPTNDPKIATLLELIKKDPQRFNEVLEIMENPEKFKTLQQFGKDQEKAKKRASEVQPKNNAENSKKETKDEKVEEDLLAYKAQIEELKKYIIYYQQWEAQNNQYQQLYQQQQVQILEQQRTIEELQLQSILNSNLTIDSGFDGINVQPTPYILSNQSTSNSFQFGNNQQEFSNNSMVIPPVLNNQTGNIIGSSDLINNQNVIVTEPTLGGNNNASGLSNQPNGNISASNLNLGNSNGTAQLQTPTLLNSGSTSSGGLQPPTSLNNSGGPGSGGLPAPNLLNNGGSGGLPSPNLLNSGEPAGLLPPNLLTKGPGGLPPPNLLNGGPGGLPPPNLLSKGPGGLPSPNLGAPGDLLPSTLKPGGSSTASGGLGGPPNLNLGASSEPKKNFKPIFWETLPPQKFNDTIWASANQAPVDELTFDDIEDMFLNAPSQTATSNGASGGKSEVKKVEIISFIADPKRAYNMNIMVSKFKKYTLLQMRTAVDTMDESILTPDACSALLPFVPEKNEIAAAASYEGKIGAIDSASQYIYAVHKIPRLQLRYRNIIFKADFPEKLDAYTKDVESFREGCILLTSNEDFKKFLKIALNIGNTLNAGTARGGAYGFKLGSLVAFMNTKGNKPNTTLLSYIVQQVYAQKPEWLEFTKEFDKLTDPSKINIDNLLKDIVSLKGQVQNVKGTMDIAAKANPPDPAYVSCFTSFYEFAWPKVTATEARIIETRNLYIQTAKFLGEDDESLKKKTSEEFFAIFVNMNNNIKKTIKDEEERKKREARPKK